MDRARSLQGPGTQVNSHCFLLLEADYGVTQKNDHIHENIEAVHSYQHISQNLKLL